MTLDRWVKILPLLEEFQTAFHRDVPKLEIIAATDRSWSDLEYEARRPEGFPSQLQGVYLLFNSQEELNYVGVAMHSYNKRVWAWDETPEFDRRYIDIIPFPRPYTCFALALEYLLICRLKPPFNKSYKSYTIPPFGISDVDD